MITENLISGQQELHHYIHNPLQLLKLLEIEASLAHKVALKQNFRLQVPSSYVARMRKGDPDDPLLRQVLPLIEENKQLQRFSKDPVGDGIAEKAPGLLHKYHGRVLLVTTGACAIHCRYCFRQHYHYSAAKPFAALESIRADTSITEVILSGGDPLVRLVGK